MASEHSLYSKFSKQNLQTKRKYGIIQPVAPGSSQNHNFQGSPGFINDNKQHYKYFTQRFNGPQRPEIKQRKALSDQKQEQQRNKEKQEKEEKFLLGSFDFKSGHGLVERRRLGF